MPSTAAQLWTIDQLSAHVALVLGAEDAEMPNGRIREVPDLRTIRYYTTLGLIDRPSEMRGRTALYGRRHLLQLVAIKRLQGQGLTLAEVQQRLLGMSDAALRALARLPASLTSAEATPTDQPARRAFWSEVPSLAETTDENQTAHNGTAAANFAWQAAPLEDGVLLLFETSRSMHEEDLAALRAAAAPLLKLLHKRGLRGPRKERGTP